MKNTITTLLLVFSVTTNALTIEQVWQEINYDNILFPEIVLKQAILESGWEESYISIKCNSKNNLFGFRKNHEYMYFNNWQESVLYYANWQNRKYIEGDYYQFLINIGYASDIEYITKLKSIKINK